MSTSLSAERDRIQRQVDRLERSLCISQAQLDLLSSATDDDDEDEDQGGQSAAGLLAQKTKIQQEIQNLEGILGPHTPPSVSGEDEDEDDEDSRSSDESELGLPSSLDSCLQLNLVYQQVVQDTVAHLETLLAQNRRQQRELALQMSGPARESTDRPPRSSYQPPARMFLGRFLKPYFKDKLTGLGPPANEEAKQRALRMAGCLDDKKLKPKRWESWQKTLLVHSVARDRLKRLVQPKLSRVDYLSQKMSSAEEAERQVLRENIDALEAEIELLREKKEEELIGDRYEEHDWQKISNIDFEGTKDAEDIRLFWQNFLHPVVNKSSWSREEVQQLKEVSSRHRENGWEEISQELGTGRTAFMCLQMFQRFVSDSLKRAGWTPDEDALLRELVDKTRIGNFIPYTQMSYFMEGREPGQLIYRWNQVLDPSLKKGPWSTKEDQLLLRAVARHGQKWWKVRSEVPGRTDGACRDRYLDCLKKDLKKGAFSQEERRLLQELVQKHGVGRWSKIAAEIPHRVDAQCLREWKKLSQPAQQRKKKGKTQPKRKRGGGGGEGRSRKKARKRSRKCLVTVKEENLTEDEEEGVEVQYMDSDEEEKTKGTHKEMAAGEEQEEEYVLPPIRDWAPAEKPRPDPALTFHPAMLPSSPDGGDGEPVRSTVLEKSGRRVLLGPRPRRLRWEERHAAGAMMMVSCDQLRTHWGRLALRFKNRRARKPVAVGNQVLSKRATEYKLRAAVMPWVGNLLMAPTARRTLADVLRESGERRGASSTAVFLLLLQLMNVDTLGCKEVIQQRRSVAARAPPTPAGRGRSPRSVCSLLQQTRTGRQQERQSLMLQRLQEVQEETHAPRPPPASLPQPRLLQAPPQPHPLILPAPPQPHLLILQAPPHIRCQMAPLLLRQPLLPHPHIQLLRGPSLTPPLPAPTAAPPPAVFVAPPPNAVFSGSVTSACSPQVLPLAPPPSHQPPLSVASGCLSRGASGGVEGRSVQEASEKGEASTSFDPAAPSGEAPPPSTASPSPLSDHSYTCSSPGSTNPAPKQSGGGSSPRSRGRKRRREAEPQRGVRWTPPQQTVGGAGEGVSEEGKRLRRPTMKAKALQEAKQAQVDGGRSSASPRRTRPLRCHSQDGVVHQTPPLAQSIWVMTSAGLVQLGQAPPPGLTFMPSPSQMPAWGPDPNPILAPPPVVGSESLPVPEHRSSGPSSVPPPKVALPYRGVVKVNSLKAPPPQREGLHFDPSLIFLEPPEVVQDWLSGRGGVVVPGARAALPYMPPSVASLSALSVLLRSLTALRQASLQLLDPPRGRSASAHSQPDPAHSQPDRPGDPTDPAGPGLTQQEEEEQLRAVRQLVEERFSTNPAYQLLKSRFLSCFTVPALLATIQPIRKGGPSCQAEENEELEEEEEQQQQEAFRRGRRTRSERSSLLSGGCGAPAKFFSGIRSIGQPPPGGEQTGPGATRNQSRRVETEPPPAEPAPVSIEITTRSHVQDLKEVV